jgi:hypothetical protein
MKENAADNFNDHHRGRDANDNPRAPLRDRGVSGVVVGMPPGGVIVVMHAGEN